MSLQFQSKTVHEVNHCDWVAFVREEYPGCRYPEIGAATRLRGPTRTEITSWNDPPGDGLISVQKLRLNDWTMRRLEEFRRGKTTFVTITTLLIDLCNRDRIPEGIYYITGSNE